MFKEQTNEEDIFLYLAIAASFFPYFWIIYKRFLLHSYGMLFNITQYERTNKYCCSYMISNLDKMQDLTEFFNPFDRGVFINLCEFWLPLFTSRKPTKFPHIPGVTEELNRGVRKQREHVPGPG